MRCLKRQVSERRSLGDTPLGDLQRDYRAEKRGPTTAAESKEQEDAGDPK